MKLYIFYYEFICTKGSILCKLYNYFLVVVSTIFIDVSTVVVVFTESITSVLLAVESLFSVVVVFELQALKKTTAETAKIEKIFFMFFV